ncbi:MAG: hypothetical protein K0Q65_1310 [Clostridia bacterium]|nr:hypothetical protein [Clostridia bacterium]
MKKLSVMLLVVVMLMVLMASVVMAGGAGKATGSVYLEDRGVLFEFNAHEGVGSKAAKGMASAYSIDGNYWIMSVEDVVIEGNEACFIGPVVESNAVGTGKWMRVMVIDNGTPGQQEQPDRVYYLSETETKAKAWLSKPASSGLLQQYSVEGNLTVHK